MAISTIEKIGNHTAESWQVALSRFPKLRYAASDLARGLIRGVQLSDNPLHQGDLFRFFRDVGRTTQRLERRLQRTLKEEADAWDKWYFERIYTPTLEKVLARGNIFWLLALKHNIEPFAHGKRKGHSPFGLLGIDLGTNDWVDLVLTYQL